MQLLQILSEFPSWEPDSNEVLCAKFLYFYEQRCFTPYIQKLEKKLIEFRGLKRLQGEKVIFDVWNPKLMNINFSDL